MSPEDEADLQAEAALYGVPWSAYREMSPRERALTKASWTRRIKSEARRLGVDPDRWLELDEQERAEERMRLAGESPRPASLDEVVQKHVKSDDEEEEDVPVYTADADVPATEPDPVKRDGPTVGRIEETEKPPDLMGAEREKNPRTLVDIYARWPIGDGEHYLRVERIKPPMYQQIACAGYLGDIREQITEAQFQRAFGGREYKLTLYGPDPKGRVDPVTGLTKVKALTNPFTLTVPNLPPNLSTVPALQQPTQQESRMTQQQPWLPWAPAANAAPSTPADAQIHKANTDLLGQMLKTQSENEREARQRAERNDGEAQKSMIDFVRDQAKASMQQFRDETAARERILRDQMEKAERENEELKKKEKQITEQLQSKTGQQGDPLELIKIIGESNNKRESQTAAFYEQRLTSQADAHKAVLTTIEERHRGEIARADDRLRDVEERYKRTLEDERRRFMETERHLKEEVERVRKEEREQMETRLREQRERHDERYKDQEKSFERELRAQRDTLETRMTTSMATKDFELAALRERLEEARAAESEARQRIEENSDPIKVVEKAKANAEAMGYKPASEEPKGAWNNLVKMAGGGVGQFLANADKWLPQLLARGPQQQQQQQALQAAQAAQARQLQAASQRRPSRGVQWASEHEPPPPPRAAQPSIGFQQTAEQPPPADAPPAATPQQAPEQPPQQPQQGPAIQNTLAEAFTQEQVLGFLGNLDQAINLGLEPADFAARFRQLAPTESALMVQTYKPEDVINMVRGLPGSDASSILRPDGQQFVEALWKALKSAPAA